MPPVPKPKRDRHPTFFKEWRSYRGLTQEVAADRLQVAQSTLSRIERGLHPFDQDFLEAAAYAYQCEPADLLIRDPLSVDAIWSITDQLRKASPAQRKQVLTVVDAMLKAG